MSLLDLRPRSAQASHVNILKIPDSTSLHDVQQLLQAIGTLLGPTIAIPAGFELYLGVQLKVSCPYCRQETFRDPVGGCLACGAPLELPI